MIHSTNSFFLLTTNNGFLPYDSANLAAGTLVIIRAKAEAPVTKPNSDADKPAALAMTGSTGICMPCPIKFNSNDPEIGITRLETGCAAISTADLKDEKVKLSWVLELLMECMVFCAACKEVS